MTVALATLAEHWVLTLNENAALAARGARRYLNGFANIQNAFKLKTNTVTCVDEGIPEGIHIPGSGVLLEMDERAELLKQIGVSEFTTHDSCGAYKLAFPMAADPNRGCREWGRAEAARLGLPHRHITAGEMDRPTDLHVATVIYYDGTGRFNRIPGLPRGFTVSRKQSLSGPQDLALCLNIAMGDHGFGKLFTSSAPLRIIVFAHPSNLVLTLETLLEEASEVARPYGKRVVIEGMKTTWIARS